MATRWSAALRRVGLLCAVLLAASLPARAQPVDFDPPSRVARLADVAGTVWLYRPDNGDWVQADRNQPLTTGDRLATEAGARADLQIGSTTLRLDSGSDMTVAALDDARISLQLQAGALALRVRDAGEAGPLEVLTPEGRFSVLRAGAYRFDRGSRSSFVGVEAGQVRYDHAASALTVDAGQRGEFWLDAGGAAQYALLAPLNDAFAAWNRERDRSIDLAAASRFVSPEVTGAADLVRYGNWEQTPDYGAVWFPTAVAADWAPYSTGRWAWVAPWGWTWVDDAPWGFAPFHYGRWVQVHERWCWTPGARTPRPVYAPALVGWVGGRPGGQGGQGGFPPGFGPAIGWVPLAPREVYVPSYRSSPRYARDVNINITNVTRVDNLTRLLADPRAPRDFENRRVPHAVTIVPAAVLAERRPVGPAAAPFRDAPWARDFAQRGVGSVALTAPPVGGPAAPGRAVDPRAVRPPPGFLPGRDVDRAAGRDPGRDGAAERGVDPGRPGFAPDRATDFGRAGVPVDRGVASGRPVAPTERGQDPGRPATPTVVAPPAAEPRLEAPDARGQGGYRGRYGDETGVRPGFAPAAPGTSPTAGPAPVQPSVSPIPVQPVQRVAPAAEPQESPRMRSLPVRRGEERRGEEAGRSEGAAAVGRSPVNAPPPMTPTTSAAPAPMPTPTPQAAPVPAPAPRPIEPQRPIVSRAPDPLPAVRPEVVVPRPVEVQSPRREPPRAPEAPQAARPAEVLPRPAPAAEPRVAAPERRGESPLNR